MWIHLEQLFPLKKQTQKQNKKSICLRLNDADVVVHVCVEQLRLDILE